MPYKGKPKPNWYESKKGWASSSLGAILFVIDHWSRGQTALDIYHTLPGWLVSIAHFLPIVLFGLGLVFFEVQRRKGTKAGKGWKFVLYIGMVSVIVTLGVLSWLSPVIKCEMLQFGMGSIRGIDPSAGVSVLATINNIGPPTTLHKWGLTITLPGGEIATGQLITIPVQRFGGQANVPWGAILTSDYLWSKLEHEPLATGASMTGQIYFSFPGYHRDVVDFPGNDVVLSFEDASGKKYSQHKKVSAVADGYFVTPNPDPNVN